MPPTYLNSAKTEDSKDVNFYGQKGIFRELKNSLCGGHECIVYVNPVTSYRLIVSVLNMRFSFRDTDQSTSNASSIYHILSIDGTRIVSEDSSRNVRVQAVSQCHTNE